MILLEDLEESVRKGLENKGIIKQTFNSYIDIFEFNRSRKQKEVLSKLRINNVPNQNVWIFQSEVDNIDCLRNQNKTVEKIVLYLEGDKLFAFLVEMKRDMNKKSLQQLRAKFTCSLVRLSIFLSGNKIFTQLKGVQLFPIGVTCFNENTFGLDYNIYHGNKSLFRERFLKLSFSVEKPQQQTFIEVEPLTLSPIRIPVLFFQNPSFLDENEGNTEGFEIDFQDLLVY